MEIAILLVGIVAWISAQIAAGKKQRKAAVKSAVQYDADRTFQSSEWASDEDLRNAGCFADNGFPAGFSKSGKQIFFPGKRKPHGVVLGSTGSGKTTSCLINVILSWTFALICLDLFGELAIVCARARRRYGPVWIIAPYRMFEDELPESQFPRVGFNPLSPRYIDPENREMVGIRCAKIASAIVLKEDHAAEKYWANTSRQLVTVVMICVILYFPRRLRNLATVAAVIMGDVPAFARRMMEISGDPYVRAKLSRYATRPGRDEVKSLLEVIESARTEVEFLTEPPVADCLSRDEIDVDDVMHGKASVFVMQPQEVVNELTRFRRLVVTCFLGRLMQEDGAFATPTLLVIDELYCLGAGLEELEKAWTTVRKLNLRLYVSIPSVGALAQLFPQSYKMILDSCGLKQFCDVNLDDSELVSVMCGEREVTRRTKSVNWSPLYNYENPSNVDLKNLHVTNNNATERMPLIRPHELRNDLGPDGQITFIADVPRPILAKRLRYFEIPRLKRRASANPYVTRKSNSKRVTARTNDKWKRFLAR